MTREPPSGHRWPGPQIRLTRTLEVPLVIQQFHGLIGRVPVRELVREPQLTNPR